MNATRFFTLWWWRGLLSCRDFGYGRLANVWCWIRGRHGPVVWFNSAGTDPDMHCRDCGEDMG